MNGSGIKSRQPQQEPQRTLKAEIRGIIGFIALIWIVYAVSFFLSVNDYGIQPRSWGGLIGVATSPFLHANLGHILSNTLPLFILLCLLAGSRSNSFKTAFLIVMVGGFLLWVMGRDANHIGASGLIFGLISFLILAGFLERRFIPLLVAIVTLVLYGGTLFWGVLPTTPGVSWDGHLFGAIAGGCIAVGEQKWLAWEKGDK